MFSSDLLFALLGGMLIGAAASLLLWGAGHAAGVSGIAAGVFSERGDAWRWRAEFVAGLVVGGVLLRVVAPERLGAAPASLAALAVAGVLVGFGARVSGGCTSGHGICGLGRLSGRSLVAVIVFMATGALTVALVGGAP